MEKTIGIRNIDYKSLGIEFGSYRGGLLLFSFTDLVLFQEPRLAVA